VFARLVDEFRERIAPTRRYLDIEGPEPAGHPFDIGPASTLTLLRAVSRDAESQRPQTGDQNHHVQQV
jgi:hypothetical protein